MEVNGNINYSDFLERYRFQMSTGDYKWVDKIMKRVNHKLYSLCGNIEEAFALFEALQVRAQLIGADVIPYQIFSMMPYFLSILAMMLVARKAAYPKALLIPFRQGDRI